MRPTIAFCGFGRAGKDTAGKFVGQLCGLRYTGSLSWVGKEIVAAELGLCEQEAWETRHERRGEWFRILNEARERDPTMLIRRSLAIGDIVVGIRSGVEVRAARAAGILTHTVWIDKPSVPHDPTTEYGPGDCDLIIANDGSLADFHETLTHWCRANNFFY